MGEELDEEAAQAVLDAQRAEREKAQESYILGAQKAQFEKLTAVGARVMESHQEICSRESAAKAVKAVLDAQKAAVALEPKLPVGGDGIVIPDNFFNFDTLEHVPPDERECVMREGMGCLFQALSGAGDGFSPKGQAHVMNVALKQMRDRFG